MEKRAVVTCLLVGLIFVLSASASKAKLKMVCYYNSWASYRAQDAQFTFDYIDPNLCTHVIYAYMGIRNDGGIQISDAYLALPDNWGKDDFRKFLEIKSYNSELKMMVGIGGIYEKSSKFSRVAATPNSRKYFVNDLVYFLNKYKFDGISVDWMYPGGEGGSTSDKQNFVLLLQEMRQKFGNKWVLSILGSGNEQVFERGYDVQGINKYVDFVNLLSFDYHGSWENVTGLNAPLYPRSSETGDHRKLNQQYTVNMWMKKGMDASKLILGIPTYGRSWTLEDINKKDIGAASVRPGQPGQYTAQPGTLGYNELVEKFKYEGEWVVDWDIDANVPYAHREDFWVSFDDERSVSSKAQFIVNNGLGGAVIWALETDDFRGVYGSKFGLTNAVKTVLDSGTVGTWTPPTTICGPPTTPDPNPVTSGRLVCTEPGFLKDPTNCSRYYVCQPTIDGFIAVVCHCPELLVFDASISSCNYKEKVPGCH